MGLRDGLISFQTLNEAALSSRLDSIVATANVHAEIGGAVTQGAALFTGSLFSASFSGVGSNYLSDATPAGLNLGAQSFTLGAWVNIAAGTAQDQGILAKFTPTGNQRQMLLFYLNAANRFRFGVSSDGIDDFSISDTTAIVFGVTHLLVARYNGDTDDTVTIQADAGTVNSAAGPTTIHAGTASYDIGRADIGAERRLSGRIDEAGFWDRALTQAEIEEWWNGGSGIPFSAFTFGDGIANVAANYYYQRRRAS